MYLPFLTQVVMEQYKICVVLFALISLNIAVVPAGPNFQHALQLIKPPIDYHNGKFCSQTAEGEDKIACRIKDEPTVVLLVCKTAFYVEKACEVVINEELQFLAKLRDAGVRTVLFHEQPINGLNYRGTSGQDCSGFLEEWVDEDRGKFQHIRNAIVGKKVPDLIQEVIKLTPPSDAGLLAATATDLMDIKDYMLEPETKYRQICDLQGFFLKNGGFLINDVPDIKEKSELDKNCWTNPPTEPPEPTTREVLEALDAMINAFHQAAQIPKQTSKPQPIGE